MLRSFFLRAFVTLWLSLSVAEQSLLAQSYPESQGNLDFAEATAGSPWVFLGDSNTYSGGYVSILDAWLGGAELASVPKLLNLGMSSETASGESEVDHPFKRPCVHERLDKVLALTKPAVVFICYGMNDGIYQPRSDENLDSFKHGMRKLAAAVKGSGAKLVCMTPPIFESEPVSIQGKLGPSADGRFAYFAPYEGYDQVLESQTEWLLTNEIEADLVVDIHRLLHSEKSKRVLDDPKFSYSKDGVHFGTEAHALIAEAILQKLRAPQFVLDAYPSNEAIAIANQRMTLLRNAYLSATGKNRPGLPAGFPVWYAEKLVSGLQIAP